ncbi:MAG: nuclear transport factor 2 family protein [Actinomycetota bacterium]|nr:nuclear transport factor 2 family protein [Actinomycetota bacterium]
MLRRTLLLLAAMALVVAGCSQDSDPAATATAIVDEWNVAWMADDVDAVVALFTVDGVYRDPVRTLQGQDSIRSFVEWMSPRVTYGERLGEGVPTESGSFVFPMRFEAHDDMLIGELEVKLAGDLASLIGWVSWEEET